MEPSGGDAATSQELSSAFVARVSFRASASAASPSISPIATYSVVTYSASASAASAAATSSRAADPWGLSVRRFQAPMRGR